MNAINTQYCSLIVEFIRNDIRLRYRNSVLGVLWSMLDPLLHMMVLTIVFSSIFRNNIPNFPVYVLTGRLIFGFFSNATTQCMHSMIRHSGIIKKVYVPKFIFPLSDCLSGFVIFLISLVPLFGLMIFTGVRFSLMNVLAIYPLLTLLISSYGLGLILASMYVFFRDISYIYSVALQVLMYMSAIFYSPDIIPRNIQYFMHLNPIYSVINVFRDCILRGEIYAKPSWVISGIYAVLLISVGTLVFKKVQHRFIYFL